MTLKFWVTVDSHLRERSIFSAVFKKTRRMRIFSIKKVFYVILQALSDQNTLIARKLFEVTASL